MDIASKLSYLSRTIHLQYNVPIKYNWMKLAIALCPTTVIWESFNIKDVVLQRHMVVWASHLSFTILPSVFSVSVLKSAMGSTLTPASCIRIVSVINWSTRRDKLVRFPTHNPSLKSYSSQLLMDVPTLRSATPSAKVSLKVFRRYCNQFRPHWVSHFFMVRIDQEAPSYNAKYS